MSDAMRPPRSRGAFREEQDEGERSESAGAGKEGSGEHSEGLRDEGEAPWSSSESSSGAEVNGGSPSCEQAEARLGDILGGSEGEKFSEEHGGGGQGEIGFSDSCLTRGAAEGSRTSLTLTTGRSSGSS